MLDEFKHIRWQHEMKKWDDDRYHLQGGQAMDRQGYGPPSTNNTAASASASTSAPAASAPAASAPAASAPAAQPIYTIDLPPAHTSPEHPIQMMNRFLRHMDRQAYEMKQQRREDNYLREREQRQQRRERREDNYRRDREHRQLIRAIQASRRGSQTQKYRTIDSQIHPQRLWTRL